jgi:RNA polymerase sigma-70 factor (ECF subfamily)
MPVTDEELMLRFARGDASAFATLLEKFKPQIVEFAEHIVRDRGTAEDVAQETFLRVFRKKEAYRPTARFSTWLYTIVTNLCYDELRKHRRQVSLESMLGPVANVEDRLQGAARSRPHPFPRPDVEAEQRELTGLVEELVESLTEEHRTAIRLRIHKGLGYAEIARRLGCSIGTAKSRTHYAMKRLGEKLMRRL